MSMFNSYSRATASKAKGQILVIALLTWVRLATKSALQFRKWHYAAIHCPRQRTIGPTVCS